MNENNCELISIIVPVYNIEKYLERCVQSILNQSYQNIEVVLIDDGSLDQSGRICDEFQNRDSRVKVIHRENRGVSATRNQGIDVATGKYLLFVDSDDFVEKDYCMEMYRLKIEYPNAFVMCGFQIYKDKPIHKYYHTDTEDYSLLDTSELLTLIDEWLVNSPCNKLYDVELLKKCHIHMHEDIFLGEDLLFNFDYLEEMKEEKIAIVNKPLYNYFRQDSGTLSSKYCPEQLKVVQQINKRLYDLCEKFNINNKEFYYSLVMRYLEGVFENNMSPGNKIPYIQKIKENNKIMKSQEYRDALKKSGKVFSLPRRLASTSGYYFVLRLCFLYCKIWFPIKEYLYEKFKKPMTEKMERLWKKNGLQ